MTKQTDSKEVVFNPSKSGLERSLGPLEAAIMSAVWDNSSKPININKVQRTLRETYKDLQYTTVASTMSRLVNKGMLTRELSLSDGAFMFVSTETRDEYRRRVVSDVLVSLYEEDRDLFLSFYTWMINKMNDDE